MKEDMLKGNAHKAIAFLLIFVAAPTCLVAQDITDLGGALSTSIPGHNALQVTAPNVTDADLIDKQLNGFIPFHKRFVKSEGLGKNFINSSCGGCHVQNGKGTAKIRQAPGKENKMVIKVSIKGLNEDGSPQNVPGVGEQLGDRTIGKKRVANYNMRLRWRKVKGKYPDGTSYKLRKPRFTYKIPGFKRRNLATSIRMSPALVGLGLMEAIPESAILALSDPEDSNSDGISGKPQYVPNFLTNQLELGRFGFRASHPNVAQQTAGAAFHDMGITNPIINSEGEEPELDAAEFEKLVIYQLLASTPRARDQDDPEVIQGKALFQSVGCSDCHTMTFVTEHDEYEDLDGQTIHPFTDMLLHDMGPALADKRAEFAASGSEWRTTPLWGLGHKVSKIKKLYMHDGRARTLEEAILWHGGEAESAKDNFMNLQKSERNALIRFLRSL